MQLFVDEITARYPHENIVMVMDGAGWHKNQAMKLAENMRILFLPPYSPELNPQEHVWDELREQFFHNRAFDSLDALEIHLESALKALNQTRKLCAALPDGIGLLMLFLNRIGIRLYQTQ